MAKKEIKNYDDAFEELQSILQKLQDENTGIEKLAEYIKRAKELQAYCKNRLREIEENINEEN
jgi:exodeoxyribonuclease VII small subunit